MTNRVKVIIIDNMISFQAKDTIVVPNTKPSMLIEKLPCLPALIGKLAFKSSTYELSDSLPALRAQHKDLLIDANHLARYRALCGFQPGSKIPATYLQTLAMPLLLNIMSNSQFPIRVIGKMHLSNQVSVHENFDLRQPVSLSVSIGRSLLSSRGLEWKMDFAAMVDNQLVWSGDSIYLYKCKTGMSRRKKGKLIRGDNPQDWLVPNGIGRRYALISQDCNPFHLSNLTARMFGFRSAIAHGMWTKARCIAGLEDQLPDSGYSVNVNFYRPLFLPSKVKFFTRQLDSGQHFSLFNKRGEKPYLTGLIS